MEKISRRSFIQAAGTVAAAGVAASAVGAAHADETGIPAEWAAETDILIVGCGGAGIAAAITAADEGLGDALVLEAAPDGLEGGNTRVSAQVIFAPTSVDGAIEYQTNLNGGHVVAPELMQAWAENITQNPEWLESQGIKVNQTAFFNPEWPEVEGSENSMCYLVGEEMGFGQLWDALAKRANELGVVIQHDTRVTELITNPQTGEVIGARDENGNAYKARKGVLLACGGFENNPEMISNYFQIGFYETRPYGTPYNRGDGILMAQSLGAELWHMNNFANSGYGNLSAGEDYPCVIYSYWPKRDYIYVGPDGTRFQYEETNGLARHGKYLTSGCATNMTQPVETWAIFGSDTFDDQSREGCIFQQDFICGWNVIHDVTKYHSNQEYLDHGFIFKGETAEELAEQIGLDPTTLAETVAKYNEYCANNEDPEFHRGTNVYSAFNYGAQGDAASKANYADSGSAPAATEDGEEMEPSIRAFNLVELKAPYYACRMYTGTLNTQGGPRRGADGAVLKVGGNPIPRLYAAGEMGTIYSYNYNGGGNVSEAMSSGRLAARSIGALDSWE